MEQVAAKVLLTSVQFSTASSSNFFYYKGSFIIHQACVRLFQPDVLTSWSTGPASPGLHVCSWAGSNLTSLRVSHLGPDPQAEKNMHVLYSLLEFMLKRVFHPCRIQHGLNVQKDSLIFYSAVCRMLQSGLITRVIHAAVIETSPYLISGSLNHIFWSFSSKRVNFGVSPSSNSSLTLLSPHTC